MTLLHVWPLPTGDGNKVGNDKTVAIAVRGDQGRLQAQVDAWTPGDKVLIHEDSETAEGSGIGSGTHTPLVMGGTGTDDLLADIKRDGARVQESITSPGNISQKSLYQGPGGPGTWKTPVNIPNGAVVGGDVDGDGKPLTEVNVATPPSGGIPGHDVVLWVNHSQYATLRDLKFSDYGQVNHSFHPALFENIYFDDCIVGQVMSHFMDDRIVHKNFSKGLFTAPYTTMVRGCVAGKAAESLGICRQFDHAFGSGVVREDCWIESGIGDGDTTLINASFPLLPNFNGRTQDDLSLLVSANNLIKNCDAVGHPLSLRGNTPPFGILNTDQLTGGRLLNNRVIDTRFSLAAGVTRGPQITHGIADFIFAGGSIGQEYSRNAFVDSPNGILVLGFTPNGASQYKIMQNSFVQPAGEHVEIDITLLGNINNGFLSINDYTGSNSDTGPNPFNLIIEGFGNTIHEKDFEPGGSVAGNILNFGNENVIIGRENNARDLHGPSPAAFRAAFQDRMAAKLLEMLPPVV